MEELLIVGLIHHGINLPLQVHRAFVGSHAERNFPLSVGKDLRCISVRGTGLLVEEVVTAEAHRELLLRTSDLQRIVDGQTIIEEDICYLLPTASRDNQRMRAPDMGIVARLRSGTKRLEHQMLRAIRLLGGLG